jgi:hypothetical protein
MNDPEQDIAAKITAYLDQGTKELKAGTVYRLQQARARALAQLDGGARVRVGQGALATGRGTSIPGDRPFYAQARVWLGIAVIAAAGFGWQQWQAYQQVKEFEDLDAQILSSDLPIDAYLDRGFQAWLTSTFDR